ARPSRNRCVQARDAGGKIHRLERSSRGRAREHLYGKTVTFTQRSERFAAVARGDVEIGFNQISEIIAARGVELLGPLPEAIQKLYRVCRRTRCKQQGARGRKGVTSIHIVRDSAGHLDSKRVRAALANTTTA